MMEHVYMYAAEAISVAIVLKGNLHYTQQQEMKLLLTATHSSL